MSVPPIRGRVHRGLIATLAFLWASILAPGMAQASMAAFTSLSFPTQVTVGQTGLIGKVTVQNFNTGAHAGMSNRMCNDADVGGCDDGAERELVLTPSCAVLSANGTCAAPDPNVFRLAATAAGTAGACLNTTFDIAVVDATFGRVSFTPRPAAAHVTLPSSGALCEISFAFSVLRAPGDQDDQAPGIQTAMITAHTQCLDPCGGSALRATALANDTITVSRATPTIAPNAPDGAINLPMTSRAVVSGLIAPVSYGKISFKLYRPSDTGCTGPPLLTTSKTVTFASPSVAEATSAAFTPTELGVYRWIMSFDGDPNNVPVANSCGSPGSTQTVGLALPPPPPPPPLPPPPGGTPPPPPPPPAAPPAEPHRTCAGKRATIVAAAGATVVTGTAGADVIVAGDGAQQIDGRGGKDTICAGKGNDVLRGGSGNDLLLGDGGNDRLLGGSGNDSMLGAAGNDRLGGGAGRDRSDGGIGSDVFDEQGAGGAGRDRLIGGAGNDRVRALDRTGDSIDCGAGRDSLVADRLDRSRACERVRRSA